MHYSSSATASVPFRGWRLIISLAATALVNGALGQMADTVHLDIETSNVRSYRYDSPDSARFASDPGTTTAVVAPNFQQWVSLQDLRFANGKPVRGVMVFRVTRLAMSPAPAATGAVADVVRPSIVDVALELLDATGQPLGGITAHGLFGGTAPTDPLRPLGGPPPGFPHVDFAGNVAVTGGTGIFFGARGYLVSGPSVQLPTVAQPLPDGSVTENPRNRRSIGPLANSRFVLVLLPAHRPAVLQERDQPLIYHADFSLVTAGNPARRGETLILRAVGLGPTTPGLAPGARFTADQRHIVVAPMEATIADRPAEIVNQIGWPGTSDEYRLDLRVPDDISAGTAVLSFTSGFVSSAQVSIAVR